MIMFLGLVAAVVGFTDLGTMLDAKTGLPIKSIAQASLLYSAHGIGVGYDWARETQPLDGLYALAGMLPVALLWRRWSRAPKLSKFETSRLQGAVKGVRGMNGGFCSYDPSPRVWRAVGRTMIARSKTL
jgi:hypothetical protein